MVCENTPNFMHFSGEIIPLANDKINFYLNHTYPRKLYDRNKYIKSLSALLQMHCPNPRFPEAESQAQNLIKINNVIERYSSMVSSSWVPPERDPEQSNPRAFISLQTVHLTFPG